MSIPKTTRYGNSARADRNMCYFLTRLPHTHRPHLYSEIIPLTGNLSLETEVPKFVAGNIMLVDKLE